MTDPQTPESAELSLRWRKKPVEIEAVRVLYSEFNPSLEDWEEAFEGRPFETMPQWLVDAIVAGDLTPHTRGGTDDAQWDIKTLEGTMTARSGDWIIRGIKGELYPCKADIFAATYEPARRALGTSEAGVREALASAIKIAGEAAEEWDKAPDGMRAGKILIALSGRKPGYRADTDAIHAALAAEASRSPRPAAEVRAADIALAFREAKLLSPDGTYAQGAVRDFVTAVRAALASSIPAVEVKPLVWTDLPANSDSHNTPLGHWYRVISIDGEWHVMVDGRAPSISRWPTRAEAKAATNTYFGDSIRACLAAPEPSASSGEVFMEEIERGMKGLHEFVYSEPGFIAEPWDDIPAEEKDKLRRFVTTVLRAARGGNDGQR